MWKLNVETESKKQKKKIKKKRKEKGNYPVNLCCQKF